MIFLFIDIGFFNFLLTSFNKTIWRINTIRTARIWNLKYKFFFFFLFIFEQLECLIILIISKTFIRTLVKLNESVKAFSFIRVLKLLNNFFLCILELVFTLFLYRFSWFSLNSSTMNRIFSHPHFVANDGLKFVSTKSYT